MLHQVARGRERSDLGSSVSSCATNGMRCLMLNTSKNRAAGGNNSRYALALIFSITSKGPIFRDFNLLYSPSAKRSRVRTAHTWSPTLNCRSRLWRSALALYLADASYKLSWTCACITETLATKSIAWPWSLDVSGATPRSNGPRGTMPYTIRKGLKRVLLLTAWLWANSTWQSTESQDFMLPTTKQRSMLPSVRLVTSVWPLVCGWYAELMSRLVRNRRRRERQKWLRKRESLSDTMDNGKPWRR